MSLHLSSPFRLGSILFLMAVSCFTARAQETETGCTDFWACNFNDEATEDDGTCEYLSCLGCTNQYACNYDPLAFYNDGTCEYLSCVGCMAELACNFDPFALVPNTAACDFESCVGCTDFTACTFDPEATLTDLNECEYPESGFDCAGNPTGCTGCEPVFLTNLPFTTVNCVDEFSLVPQEGILAVNGCTGDTLDVHSFAVDVTNNYTNNLGVTANGIGPDGAIRVFGLSALGLANSDYFVETFPLLVTRYANGIAVVNGQVHNVLNPNLIWNVHMVLENPVLGNEWLDQNPEASFVTAYGCSVDTSEVVTYQLSHEHSFLIGAGGYEGSYLQLSHMPFNDSKRFQLGNSGNSVNCNYGLGGWFAWEGRVLETEVNGMSGDLVIDLGDDITNEVACGSEMVGYFHHSLNAECGLFSETIQVFARSDQEAPQWNSTACEDAVSLCFDSDTQTTAIPSPCAFAFEDECGEPVQTTLSESIISGDPELANDQPFTIQRTYSGTDCSGNSAAFVQTLVFDGAACPQPPSSPQENPWNQRYLKGHKIQNSAEHTVLGIFPNPTSESSDLQVHLHSESLLEIAVYDLTGEQVLPMHRQFGFPGETLHCLLDASALRPGCYLVQIQEATRRSTLRWTVVR